MAKFMSVVLAGNLQIGSRGVGERIDDDPLATGLSKLAWLQQQAGEHHTPLVLFGKVLARANDYQMLPQVMAQLASYPTVILAGNESDRCMDILQASRVVTVVSSGDRFALNRAGDWFVEHALESERAQISSYSMAATIPGKGRRLISVSKTIESVAADVIVLAPVMRMHRGDPAPEALILRSDGKASVLTVPHIQHIFAFHSDAEPVLVQQSVFADGLAKALTEQADIRVDLPAQAELACETLQLSIPAREIVMRLLQDSLNLSETPI